MSSIEKLLGRSIVKIEEIDNAVIFHTNDNQKIIIRGHWHKEKRYLSCCTEKEYNEKLYAGLDGDYIADNVWHNYKQHASLESWIEYDEEWKYHDVYILNNTKDDYLKEGKYDRRRNKT